MIMRARGRPAVQKSLVSGIRRAESGRVIGLQQFQPFVYRSKEEQE